MNLQTNEEIKMRMQLIIFFKLKKLVLIKSEFIKFKQL